MDNLKNYDFTHGAAGAGRCDGRATEADLREATDLFAVNTEILSRFFGARDMRIVIACAALFTANRQKADTMRLQACKGLIRKQFGVFSAFRGQMEPFVLTNMAVSTSPERYVYQMERIYSLLAGRMAQDGIVLASMILAGDPDLDTVQAVERTNDIYKRIKALHPLITGPEDLPQAAMVAATGEDPARLMEDMEACMELLKRFAGKNVAQALSLSLMLADGTPQEKCARIETLYASFREHRIPVKEDVGMAILGSLLTLDAAADVIAEEILFVSSLLKEHKELRPVNIGGRGTRTLFAAVLVLEAHADPYSADLDAANTAVLSVINIINIEMANLTTVVLINS